MKGGAIGLVLRVRAGEGAARAPGKLNRGSASGLAVRATCGRNMACEPSHQCLCMINV